MINFILSHKILAVIIVVLLAAAVWIGLSSGSSSSSLLTTETVDQNSPDQDLVQTLLALRAVKLDGAVFSDPGFQSLKDFSTQIVPEPVGRPNPFAPLNATVVVTTNTTQAAQIFKPAKTTK